MSSRASRIYALDERACSLQIDRALVLYALISVMTLNRWVMRAFLCDYSSAEAVLSPLIRCFSNGVTRHI